MFEQEAIQTFFFTMFCCPIKQIPKTDNVTQILPIAVIFRVLDNKGG